VPGHEIIVRVVNIGPDVTRFKQGDHVGVGCMVDSCPHCAACKHGLEQYCEEGPTYTYSSIDRIDHMTTFSGHSEKIIVPEKFVLRIPEGLGHMAIKLSEDLGVDVTLFTRSPGKEQDARLLGADNMVICTDASQMTVVNNKFDLIIYTVPYAHDLNLYMPSLSLNDTLVLVGFLSNLEPILNTTTWVRGRKLVAGSSIGDIAETQELLDFCGYKHGITQILS